MVRAVVRLGRTLGLKVVAEGVETPEQQRALAAAGCHSIQGFLTGAPVAADEILNEHFVDERPRKGDRRGARIGAAAGLTYGSGELGL